jgi:hypothetical protein
MFTYVTNVVTKANKKLQMHICYSFEAQWIIYVYTTYKVNSGASHDPQDRDYSPQNQPVSSAF